MIRIPVFDGHNDTLTRLYLPERGGGGRSFFQRGESGHIDLPRAREGGLIGGIFAIFTPPPYDSPEHDPTYGATITADGYDVRLHSPLDHAYAKRFTGSVLDFLARLEAEAGGAIGLVHSWHDLERNLHAGTLSVVLHFEGAEAILPDLGNLEEYYAQGLRSLGLTWSRPNAFGCGVPFRFPHSPDTGPGLTDAGRRLVRACNRLGIVIDLAHINEKGFWDTAGLTDAPLVVSHAGVHALCPSTRNLTDAQIDAIGQSGGVMGIIFEPTNTRRDGKPVPDTPTPLTEIVRHINYVVERIGIDHVALGSDFDGAEMPDDLRDVTGLPRLIQALQDQGYDRGALEKIAYKNWFRVLQATWKP
jgi:membrane dipeptidase